MKGGRLVGKGGKRGGCLVSLLCLYIINWVTCTIGCITMKTRFVLIYSLEHYMLHVMDLVPVQPVGTFNLIDTTRFFVT